MEETAHRAYPDDVRAFLVLLIGVLAAPSAFAEPVPEPYSRVHVSVGRIGTNFHDASGDFFDPGSGIALGATTPFALGVLEAGLERFAVSADDPGRPDFDALVVALGWGLRSPDRGRFRVTGTARTGVVSFDFDTVPGVPNSGKLENELLFEGRLVLRGSVAGAWTAGVAAGARVVMTRKRMKHTTLSLELGREFETPGWLRGFLK